MVKMALRVMARTKLVRRGNEEIYLTLLLFTSSLTFIYFLKHFVDYTHGLCDYADPSANSLLGSNAYYFGFHQLCSLPFEA